MKYGSKVIFEKEIQENYCSKKEQAHLYSSVGPRTLQPSLPSIAIDICCGYFTIVANSIAQSTLLTDLSTACRYSRLALFLTHPNTCEEPVFVNKFHLSSFHL